MPNESNVIAERLADLGAWEMYRFTVEDTDEVVCTVALRPGGGDIEYGVFRGEDGEPSATGLVARDGRPWSDAAREGALEEILDAYEPKLPALRGHVVYDLEGS
jgi:hypothetical protein